MASAPRVFCPIRAEFSLSLLLRVRRTTPPCIGHLPTPRAAPPPLAKATSFASIDEFIDGLPPAPPPPCRLAKQGNKFMKDSLASVTAQQNRIRRSQSAPPARMGCTRHALAIEKAGSPQPVFRTRRARLARARTTDEIELSYGLRASVQFECAKLSGYVGSTYLN